MTILFGYDPMVINSNTNCDTNHLLFNDKQQKAASLYGIEPNPKVFFGKGVHESIRYWV